MSIALSVLLLPSRRLRALRCAYAGALGAAGAAIGAGALGCYAQPWWPALACWTGAALALFPGARPIPHRLDVSGLGELRLTVQLSGGGVVGAAPAGAGAAGEGGLRLLPGSTLWPAALLLRLQDARGAAVALALLPDSVASGEFRALSVAFAAIAKMKIF
jgi:hypothetical protein